MQALKDFVDSADKGVVVFSLGFTGFEPKDIPAEVVAAFVKAFSRLEQKVIMRFDKEYIVGKPDNVMVTTWIPQQDLLGKIV
jgi:glucuronosyltransferase